jgi:hypothetical protein
VDSPGGLKAWFQNEWHGYAIDGAAEWAIGLITRIRSLHAQCGSFHLDVVSNFLFLGFGRHDFTWGAHSLAGWSRGPTVCQAEDSHVRLPTASDVTVPKSKSIPRSCRVDRSCPW